MKDINKQLKKYNNLIWSVAHEYKAFHPELIQELRILLWKCLLKKNKYRGEPAFINFFKTSAHNRIYNMRRDWIRKQKREEKRLKDIAKYKPRHRKPPNINLDCLSSSEKEFIEFKYGLTGTKKTIDELSQIYKLSKSQLDRKHRKLLNILRSSVSTFNLRNYESA